MAAAFVSFLSEIKIKEQRIGFTFELILKED